MTPAKTTNAAPIAAIKVLYHSKIALKKTILLENEIMLDFFHVTIGTGPVSSENGNGKRSVEPAVGVKANVSGNGNKSPLAEISCLVY